MVRLGSRLVQHSSHIMLIAILITVASCFWFVINANVHQTNVHRTIIAENPTPSVNTLNIAKIRYPTPIPTPTPIAALRGLPTSITSQGWKQIFAEDFTTNVAVGSFPGNVYGSEFTVYPDGTKDTAGQQGAPSRYYPSKVASVSNGVLNLYLHTENGTPMAAAILPILPGNHLYGLYMICFRADALPGFKVASLLWPDNDDWPQDGEIDFPEGGLGGNIGAFMHYQNGTSGSDQDAYTTTATFPSWHTATLEWSPQAVSFLLDGRLIGRSIARIPDTPMHWVVQTESCQSMCPAATTAGNFQIDWMTAYAPI